MHINQGVGWATCSMGNLSMSNDSKSWGHPLGGGRLGKLALCRPGIDGLFAGSNGFDQLKKTVGRRMLTSWPNIYVVWILRFSYIDVNKVYYVGTGISIHKGMPLYPNWSPKSTRATIAKKHATIRKKLWKKGLGAIQRFLRVNHNVSPTFSSLLQDIKQLCEMGHWGSNTFHS